jgi:hypothetical protein
VLSRTLELRSWSQNSENLYCTIKRLMLVAHMVADEHKAAKKEVQPYPSRLPVGLSSVFVMLTLSLYAWLGWELRASRLNESGAAGQAR